MRKCIRCGSEMREECAIRQQDNACGLVIVKGGGIFGRTVGKVKAAVCPECGEISLYVEETEKLKER